MRRTAEYVIELADEGDPIADRTGIDRDAPYRLRQLLKALRRGYGFKAVRVAPNLTPDPAQDPVPTKETA